MPRVPGARPPVGPERPLAMSAVRKFGTLALLAVASSAPPASAVTVNVSTTFDRWMYPFGATPGTESAGSSFGAVGDDGFDDRDSQFLVGFNTSGVVTPGAGPTSYNVASARLTVKV